MKKWVLWTAIGLLLALAVIGTVSRQVPVRESQLEGSIMSLAPSVTEILFALGVQDRLIGVSTACDYPPAATHIRKVGDFAVPDIELLYALKPELVITTPLRDPEAGKAIRFCGAKLLTVKQGDHEEVFREIEVIGDAPGDVDAARRDADKLRERFARATVNVPDALRPRVYVEISPRPLRTAAKGSFLDDLIYRAGGINIAHDFSRPWTTISPEAVVARNPEIIILAYQMSRDAPYAIADRIGWSGLDAVRSGHVVTGLDRDTLTRPGPRLVEGLEALAGLFARYRKGRTQ